MASTYKFYYFPVRGRAEFIRYILHYANVPYEEIAIERDKWEGGKKKEFPFGTIPVLELENGFKLGQSLAIGRYLATKFGLTSNDDLENALGDQIVGAIEDLNFPYFRHFRLAFMANDQAKIKETLEVLEKNGLIPLFNRLEKLLGDKTWFCGKDIHWADLMVAELIDRMETAHKKPELVAKFPRLLAHCRRVHAIPNIRKYTETRPKYQR